MAPPPPPPAVVGGFRRLGWGQNDVDMYDSGQFYLTFLEKQVSLIPMFLILKAARLIFLGK